MEEELDIQKYLRVLIDQWLVIVGTTVLAGVLAIIIVLVLPRTYEATALVAITQPRQEIQFDARIRSTAMDQSLLVFPELAMSDELLQDLLVETDSFVEAESIEDLKKMLRARPGSDASLVRLIATARTPETAAQLANIWAAKFVNIANELYGDQGREQVAFFESRLEQGRADMVSAEQALIEFQGRNQTDTLNVELSYLLQTQNVLFNAERSLTFLANDTRNLLAQIQRQSENPVNVVNQLNILMLQIRAFNTDVSASGPTGRETGVASASSAAVPLILQLDDSVSLSALTPLEQVAFLENTESTLAAKTDQIANGLQALEPRILDLQQRIQELSIEEDRLVLNLQLKKEFYTTMVRKVEEEQIASQDSISGIRLASTASVPINPSGLRRSVVVLGGTAVGLFLGVFFAFVNQWIRSVWKAEAGNT